MNEAITSVWCLIAVWIPVTVVPTSSATVAIAVFMTVVSRAITNCPAASVRRTIPVPLTGRAASSVTALLPSPEARADSHLHVRQHQSRAGETHVLCGCCFRGRVILPARRSVGRRQGGLELGL